MKVDTVFSYLVRNVFHLCEFQSVALKLGVVDFILHPLSSAKSRFLISYYAPK